MLGDFHLHSRYSDGRLDPIALIDVVCDAGMRVVALTDHDTTHGHFTAAQRSRERGIHFVPGIEMTTYAYGRVIHMLGLGIDSKDAALEAVNATTATVWDANQCCWVEALASEGVDVAFDRDFGDHPVRLPVLIERLCLRGVDGGDPVAVHRRFRSFFASLPPDAYERLASPSSCASVIRNAGGVALLAHPDGLREAQLLDELLEHCDGLEAMYVPYSDGQREALRAFAEQRGKLYSCGSDYHGYFETHYRPPTAPAPNSLLQRLKIK